MSGRVNIEGARAVRVGLGWSLGEQHLSGAISKLTDGPWSHMLIVFALDDGRSVYFEALISRDVDGPCDLEDLRDWAAENPKRKAHIEWTDIPAERAQKIMLECMADVGRRRAYNKAQLLTMLLLEKTGIAIFSMRRDLGDRVVCSEFVAEKVYPDIDLRDAKRRTFSAVNPNSGWNRWVQIRGQRRAL